MIAGTIILEDFVVNFRHVPVQYDVLDSSAKVKYTVCDTQTGLEEEVETTPEAFADAVFVAMHPNPAGDDAEYAGLYESAVNALGSIRWIP